MDAIGIIRRHWPAILLALAVGALTALPPLIAQQRMGDAYQGIRPLVIDDQIYYQARAHETQDGHPMLGNPYLREDKNQPAVQFWMPDMVLSYFNPAVLDVVFPFLIIILSYAILFKLTRDKLLSLAGAALLDPGFVYSPFLRTPNPQLFVLLLLALLLLVYALERMRTRWSRCRRGMIRDRPVRGCSAFPKPQAVTVHTVTANCVVE